MANTKISELTALGTTPADDDVLAIVDTSASTTKKVTVSNLVSAASGFDPDVDNPTIGNGASAGTEAVSIGHDASGDGTSSIAIGKDAVVSSGTTSSIAIGTNTDATADSAVALGILAQATALWGIAIGQQARVSNNGGIALGRQSSATTDAVAVGNNADASTDAISIGANTDATGSRSIAIGHEADALAQESIAIGDGANTSSGSTKAIAIGDLANVFAANTIHINSSGVSTNAPATAGHMVIETDDAKIEYDGNWDMSGGTLTLGAVTYPNTDGTADQVLTTDGAGNLSFADAGGGGFDPDVDNPSIGNDASAGTNGSAYGHDATATGSGSVAVGNNSQSLSDADVAIGWASRTGSFSAGSVALGFSANGTGTKAVSVGYEATATGTESISIGRNSDATQSRAVAVGYDAQATAVSAVAVGDNAEATGSGQNAIAIGHDSSAPANSAIAIGNGANVYDNNSYGAYTVAIGFNASVEGSYGIAIGRQADVGFNNTYGIAIGYLAQIPDSSYQESMALGAYATVEADNAMHINTSGSSTNKPTVNGQIVIESDDAKLEYVSGNWSMTPGNLEMYNGTAPTASVTDGIILYAEDVSSSSELKVRDEAGNVTTLSPHNFELIPEGPSEDMAWSYYSEKDGKRINVDMLKAIRVLERMSGEQLVFEG